MRAAATPVSPTLGNRRLRLGGFALLVSLDLGLAPSVSAAQAPPRPDGSAADVAAGSYIVTLERGYDPRREAPGLAEEHGGRVRHVYGTVPSTPLWPTTAPTPTTST